MSTFLRDTRTETVKWMKPPLAIAYGEFRCDCGTVYECWKEHQTVVCSECQAKIDRSEADRLKLERCAKETSASIPARFQWASFNAPELQQRVFPARIIQVARAAVDSTVVLLLGLPGVGKTCLGCAILRAKSAKLQKPGLWTTTFDLATARREQRLGTGEAEAIRHAENAAVLLLDELCAEQGRDTAVDEVIRTRHDYERPTIFTCGFGQEEIVKRYGGGVGRRIIEGATIIQLGGK
jgi:DNA replication protein DnaC